MKTKKCSRCGIEKPVEEFCKSKGSKDGRQYYCKECANQTNKEYFHSKKGLISKIYKSQKQHSRRRGHPLPTYSHQELQEWLYSQKKFHELCDNWKASGYKTALVPSCDRLDDYKPYTLDNLQIMTWQENMAKGHRDRIDGKNNKQNVPILQFTKDGKFVKEFYSRHQASRETGVDRVSIIYAASGKYQSAGGFIWRNKNWESN